MGTKVKNHTVTRGYLAGWKEVDATGNVGIWYYDIASRQVTRSPSTNAAFAIAKAIYAPRINGRRDDRLENWFSKSESDLCDFVRDYGSSKNRRWKPSAIERALTGVISLGYRGEYGLRLIEQYLAAENPRLSADEVTVAALNNLYNIALERAQFFLRGTALLLEWEAPTFMTNDVPFWDFSPQSTINPMGMFPLSPTRVLVLLPHEPAQGGHFQIIRRSGNDFDWIRDFAKLGAMRMARNWVVCSTEAEANAVKEYFTPERWDEITATDRMRFIGVAEELNIYTDQN